MARSKRPVGRPRVADPKDANRYSVNYSDAENTVVVAAAARADEPFVGRWIAQVALAVAQRPWLARKLLAGALVKAQR